MDGVEVDDISVYDFVVGPFAVGILLGFPGIGVGIEGEHLMVGR